MQKTHRAKKNIFKRDSKTHPLPVFSESMSSAAYWSLTSSLVVECLIATSTVNVCYFFQIEMALLVPVSMGVIVLSSSV